MLFPSLRPIALTLLLATACAEVRPVTVVPEPVVDVRPEPRNGVLRHDQALGRVMAYMQGSETQKAKDRETVVLAASLIETARHQGKSVQRFGRASAAAVTSTGSVMDCIKAHESGNYSEQSHPGSGSGAYQYVPGTWRHWSAAAGYPGYAYAYQAPADVQDAVTAFTLTHGGAGNWSTRYGNDPCTQ